MSSANFLEGVIETAATIAGTPTLWFGQIPADVTSLPAAMIETYSEDARGTASYDTAGTIPTKKTVSWKIVCWGAGGLAANALAVARLFQAGFTKTSITLTGAQRAFVFQGKTEVFRDPLLSDAEQVVYRAEINYEGLWTNPTQ